jgi:hypothetical protein
VPYALPPKYRFPHDYAIYLHDILVGLTMAGYEAGVFNVQLKLGPGDPKPDGLEGLELSAWLDEHHPEVGALLEYKQLIAALVSDSCHFTLEALRASAKGKLTVAYALSRKPFKDNLFYLEWLLSDPVEFLVGFRKGPEAIEVAKQGESRRSVIEDAVRKVGGRTINANLLYEVRYDRNAQYGLSVVWDQATHLVTTVRQARTGKRNLNLIFSGQPQWESQWQHFYYMVPYLLYHAVRVVQTLFEDLATIPKTQSVLQEIRRDLGFVLYSAWLQAGEGDDLGDQVAVFRDILDDLHLSCPQCSTPFVFHRSNLKRLVIGGTLACGRCRAGTDLVAAAGGRPKPKVRRRSRKPGGAKKPRRAVLT